MSEVRKCRAAEIFDDPRSSDLIAEYSAECAIALVGKPAPQRDAYECLEIACGAQSFAAYDDAGKLCGFALIIVAIVPHYTLSCATVESLFVSRSQRKSGLGAKLMHSVEEAARWAGCEAIFYSAPVGSSLARLLSIRPDEYTHTNQVFCRRLK